MVDRHIYKARRTDNGEWVEGNLVWSDDSVKEYKAIIIPKRKSNMFLKSNEWNLGFENWYRVDPETVCQYTGWPDKKIQKLFEGDIVKEGDDIGIVKLGKYGNGFHYGFYIEWFTCPHLRPELAFWNSRVERIGNVFDDQELLRGGKE